MERLILIIAALFFLLNVSPENAGAGADGSWKIYRDSVSPNPASK